jgi:sRNA-binding protein
MKMAYLPNRDESEQTIRLLAERYPKCFFFDPRQRKPLKRGIVLDLEKDGFPEAAYAARAVDWYQSHFGYQYALQAGVKRIDLHGKEVGTVTEQEQYAAQTKIKEDKQKKSQRSR